MPGNGAYPPPLIEWRLSPHSDPSAVTDIRGLHRRGGCVPLFQPKPQSCVAEVLRGYNCASK
ncbi:protein of unknown function [Rhodovastum atsumiense]|nr:protein of unknown function [Rhodovastum atsumiense]